jgi:hypothetical protein
MKDLKTVQDEFIQNEIWTLTFGASFQRANVYLPNALDEDKSKFKTNTRSFIEALSQDYISKSIISDETHVANIESLSSFTKQFSSILQNGKLNFGVSQKLLNLYLKYQWCLYDNFVPPHFPVDRRIQETIKFYPIVSWTKFENAKDYMRIINHVRNLSSKNTSIAAYELAHFERRTKTAN